MKYSHGNGFPGNPFNVEVLPAGSHMHVSRCVDVFLVCSTLSSMGGSDVLQLCCGEAAVDVVMVGLVKVILLPQLLAT